MLTKSIEILYQEEGMTLSINGKTDTVGGFEISVVDLLKAKDVEMPDMVSVQLNGEVLRREEFDTTMVKENDEVEFLYFMGGGA
jgi:sulfur carrier protein